METKVEETGRVVPVAEGAEAFLEMLNANQVDYIFLNPGTDTFPLQEALAKFRTLGRRAPQVILCPHESLAMAAAHGHFMISGRPQVVLVHVDLGTQNVGGQLHNAQRGHAAILLCAGRAPFTFEGELRGGRSSHIHWIQEQFNQASVVHDYVKWDYELRRNENIHHVVQRAFQVAATEPCGPVYLTLPRELLMEKIEKVHIPAPERYASIASPQADPGQLALAAELLMKAHSPLILVAFAGRHPEAVPPLVSLAELMAVPVIEVRHRMNFPTSHPLHMGQNPMPYLASADVILIIDHDVPYIPLLGRPSPDAKVIHIDIDPLKQGMPLWNFPVDVSVTADSAKAIPALCHIIQERITPEDRASYQERAERWRREHEAQRSHWEQAARTKARQRPIAPEWLAYCINRVLGVDDIVVNESVTNGPTVQRYVQREQPGTFFESGGSCLGWCLGAALGAKLAAPQRRVVSLSGDGNFANSTPIAGLWAAKVHGAPFLTIIFNNGCLNAVKRALKEGYPDSYSVSTGHFVGTDFESPPRYDLIAQACGCYGERVEEPSEVEPALRRALAEVDKGRPALLDVILEHP